MPLVPSICFAVLILGLALAAYTDHRSHNRKD